MLRNIYKEDLRNKPYVRVQEWDGTKTQSFACLLLKNNGNIGL